MEDKTLMADIHKLLDFGYVTEPCSIKSDAGEFRFELRTLSPLEELEARREVLAMDLKDDQSVNMMMAVELLGRSITTLNGVAFDSFPGAQGTTPLAKKKYVVSKLSEKVMLPLWSAYQNVKAKASLDGTPEEEEALKK